MNTCTRIITDKNCHVIVLDNTFTDDVIQVFLLKLTTSTSTSTEMFIKSESTQTVAFNNTKDGFYTLCKVTIPLDEESTTYYKKGKYYHNGESVSLQELLDMKDPGVEIEYDYFFSTCNLKKCFVKICQEIFNSKATICGKQNSVDSSLIYKRDLIWSALNVIQYMAEMDQMCEAQRLLEEITACNGLCPQDQTSSGCGCGR